MTKNEVSLRVDLKEKELFKSNRKWIYPLFDLEDYLIENPVPMNSTKIYDKVVGRAAALLFIRLGAVWIHGEIMSKLAVYTLNQWGVEFTYEQLVERIKCKTEDVLIKVNEPEIAYSILCKRANRC